ncbi:MAG: recombinase family protein [Fuerstiella sp.]
MDPDRRIQERLRLIFQKFLELGSIRQTLLWFLAEELQVPARAADGSLSWKRPRYSAFQSILTGPVYAGAYVFGRTEHGSKYEGGKTRQVSRRRPRDEWISLIPNHHEGYISWTQFEHVQKMIAGNCQGNGQVGAAKRGAALLTGILLCRKCGRKMTVSYTGNRRCFLRYACVRGQLDYGDPKCISFGGVPVDERIAQEVLRVVEPASLEAAVQASQDISGQQDAVLDSLHNDLEAARYAAARAQKQYDAADPENRLVADELERRWNAALQRVQQLEHRIADHQGLQQLDPAATTDEFIALAGDLEATRNSPESDATLKKRIVRSLIHEVIADVDHDASEVVLVIHWKGGVHTELRVPRRKRGAATRTCPDVIDAVRILARVSTDRMIAGFFNRNGLKTGRGHRWTQERVTALRTYHKIANHCPKKKEQEGWLNLTEAAAFLKLSSRTVRLAVERKEIVGEHPLPDGPWVFRRDNLVSAAAISLVQRTHHRKNTPAVPAEQQQALDFSGT